MRCKVLVYVAKLFSLLISFLLQKLPRRKFYVECKWCILIYIFNYLLTRLISSLNDLIFQWEFGIKKVTLPCFHDFTRGSLYPLYFWTSCTRVLYNILLNINRLLFYQLTLQWVCVFLSTGVENNFAFNIAFTCVFTAVFSSNFSRELALEMKCFIHLLVSNVNRV